MSARLAFLARAMPRQSLRDKRCAPPPDFAKPPRGVTEIEVSWANAGPRTMDHRPWTKSKKIGLKYNALRLIRDAFRNRTGSHRQPFMPPLLIFRIWDLGFILKFEV